MNTGKYVFAQMMEYLPRYEFDKYVRSTMVTSILENLVAIVNCYTYFLASSRHANLYEIFVYA